MKYLVECFDNKEYVRLPNGNYYLYIPLTDQIPNTPYSLIDDAVTELSKAVDFSTTTVILGDEDRGGYLSALVAYKMKKSLAMSKWYPDGARGQLCIDFKNEYTKGKMYLNGLNRGDHITIVDDLIQTGSTIIALINLAKREKGVIIDNIVAIGEDMDCDGVEKIYAETGYRAKTLVKYKREGNRSKVISF